MGWERTTFIGIDLFSRGSAQRKSFTYAGLDAGLKLLAIGRGSLKDLLAYVGGQSEAFVAVNAPRRPNQGLMSQPEVRQRLTPPPADGSWVDLRMAEYQLLMDGIQVTSTPAAEETSPEWTRAGFDLFRRLDGFGYQPYPAAGVLRQSLEVQPQASFAVWLGQLPAPRKTLEGRMQRQLCLVEQRVKLADPLEMFEEITRYRVLRGILPFKDIHTPAELDALGAALTAWTAAAHPEQITHFGDPAEGQVVLPGLLPALETA
jgi:hypothetical protein